MPEVRPLRDSSFNFAQGCIRQTPIDNQYLCLMLWIAYQSSKLDRTYHSAPKSHHTILFVQSIFDSSTVVIAGKIVPHFEQHLFDSSEQVNPAGPPQVPSGDCPRLLRFDANGGNVGSVAPNTEAIKEAAKNRAFIFWNRYEISGLRVKEMGPLWVLTTSVFE